MTLKTLIISMSLKKNAKLQFSEQIKNKYIFCFPAKCFPEQLIATSLFTNTKFESYVRKLYTVHNTDIVIIPECSIKNFIIQVELPDGDYISDSSTILPNVYLYDSVVRINNKSTYISVKLQQFSNTNF